MDDPSTYFCIILSGTVNLRTISSISYEKSNGLKRGNCFGESAIMKNVARSSDAIAKEKSEILLLEREKYIQLLLACRQKVRSFISKSLSQFLDL